MASVVACGSPMANNASSFAQGFNTPLPSSFAQGLKSPPQAFRAEAFERVVVRAGMYCDAEARVVKWRKDLLSEASFDAQQGLRELSQERSQVKDLQTDLAGVQSLVDAASQLEAGGARLAEVLQTASEAACSRVEKVAVVRNELHDMCENLQHGLQVEEQNNAQQREAADAQHAEALKLLETYKDRLGLTITRVAPQTVRMAFTLLVASDPAQEFVFTLGLGARQDALPGDASDGYHVCECIPHVPELEKLLAELNASASSATALPCFVCSMRRSFLKLINVEKVL